MTQHELIIYEMQKRGGQISTFELRVICCQYQTRLKELREEKGYEISPAIRIKGQKGNNLYRLLRIPPADGEKRDLSREAGPEQFKRQTEMELN